MQTRFKKFCAKLLTDRQTDKQRRLHILLSGGNERKKETEIMGDYTEGQSETQKEV